jgi:NADPH:quinone reductase-like Zn-dependent oxidoreductase
MPISADAWFVYAATPGQERTRATVVRERYTLDDLAPDELLLAPTYGCWEANMGHILDRNPIDICAVNGWERRILGNGGVARVIECGAETTGVEVGQHVLMFGLETDRWGYPVRIMGYDSALSGFLTTRLKLKVEHVIPLPECSTKDLVRWAAFNVRYLTAWSNWRVAMGTFRVLLSEEEFPRINVWGWGGGTALAETQLAALLGHRAVALASTSERLELVRKCGVEPLDRTRFPALQFDEKLYRSDPEFAQAYRESEAAFLETVAEQTGGDGVQIFVDLIGSPVFRATLKALGRHGIVTTAGWKAGMRLTYLRAMEAMGRHQFVHTHFSQRGDAEQAMAFAMQHDWLPIVDERIYSFDEIPELAERYAAGDYRMFPCYQVNPD